MKSRSSCREACRVACEGFVLLVEITEPGHLHGTYEVRCRRKQPIDCSDILPKGPQAVGQARHHRLPDRQIGIKLAADELERDRRAALNDQEKSRSIPIEAILGVPAGKLGLRPHARLAM